MLPIAAPTAALEHYRELNIKQTQTDTMSHLVFGRASMFSLAPMGDITFMTEAVESTHIYLSNTNDVSSCSGIGCGVLTFIFQTPEMLIRAFTGEKYSQVTIILFECQEYKY